MLKKKSTTSNILFVHRINQYTVLYVNKTDWLSNEFSASRPASLQTSVEALLGQAHVFMMPHYVLVLFRRSPEPLLAVLTAVRVVFRMNGNNMPFKA